MSADVRRPLVVILGLGETGVLTAAHLSNCDIVGVATKPALVSGQELGLRLVAPKSWSRDYFTELSRFKRLKHAKILIGRAVEVDFALKKVFVELADGDSHVQSYDYLVIATGVTNGFWRDDKILSPSLIKKSIHQHRSQLAKANTIAVVGGGATGTSVAANLAIRYRKKHIHLFHSSELPLRGYPEKVRLEIVQMLADIGVHRWPHHRAEPATQAQATTLDGGTIHWRTEQPPFAADAILWATGATRPNSAFLPPAVLDQNGYVLTESTLQLVGWPDVFAIGDVAQTDPNRSSARNWAYKIVADNIMELSTGRPDRMKRFEAPEYRWGSIFGTQKAGLTIFLPNGEKQRFTRWYTRMTLYPIKVRKEIYGGVKSAFWSLR